MGSLTLHDLPAELLFQIHLLSLSPSLPLLSHHFHALFASSPISHRALYLIHSSPSHPSKTLGHALKYKVGCSLEVVRCIERIWDEEVRREKDKDKDGDKGRRRLKCPTLSRTLFNLPISSSSSIIPLLRHLFTTFSPDPNSHKGYLLAKSVMASSPSSDSTEVIDLLLEYGADPGKKDSWAVLAAIGKGDLNLVKRLMLLPSSPLSPSSPSPPTPLHSKKRKSLSSSSAESPKKKRKLEIVTSGIENEYGLRTPATQEMLEMAVKYGEWDIVDWLVEHGAKPSLGVLKML